MGFKILSEKELEELNKKCKHENLDSEMMDEEIILTCLDCGLVGCGDGASNDYIAYPTGRYI